MHGENFQFTKYLYSINSLKVRSDWHVTLVEFVSPLCKSESYWD